MKIRLAAVIVAASAIFHPAVSCQPQPAGNAEAQQHIAALKQSMAANHAKLMKYQWIQSTEVSVKGKVRKDQQEACHYGSDGKVVKTPIGPQAAPQQAPQGGLKGRIVGKKVDEMKDYTERLKSLISHYVPPDPQMIQDAKQAGNASMNAAGGVVTLTFADYYKPGDKVSFGFDAAANKLVSFDVNTYLDDPKSDIVTLTNKFDSLPDGTNYLQQTVLDARSKQIQVTTSNSGYSLVGQ